MNDKVTYAFNYKFIIKLLEFYWDFFNVFGLQLTEHSFKNNSGLSSKSPWLFFLLFPSNLAKKHNYPTWVMNKENSRINKIINVIFYSRSPKFQCTMVL